MKFFITVTVYLLAFVLLRGAFGQVIDVAPLTITAPNLTNDLTNPAPKSTVLLPVVHRSGRNWTDPDVGRWSESTLRRHLLGELESTQHRGQVPPEQLVGRSLKELIAIHANLHEGYNWDGQPKQKQVPRRSVPSFDDCPT